MHSVGTGIIGHGESPKIETRASMLSAICYSETHTLWYGPANINNCCSLDPHGGDRIKNKSFGF